MTFVRVLPLKVLLKRVVLLKYNILTTWFFVTLRVILQKLLKVKTNAGNKIAINFQFATL